MLYSCSIIIIPITLTTPHHGISCAMSCHHMPIFTKRHPPTTTTAVVQVNLVGSWVRIFLTQFWVLVNRVPVYFKLLDHEKFIWLNFHVI